MLVYLSKRLLMMIPMLIGITLISFVVIHLAPGEPTDLQTDLNPEASVELKERLRSQYGLDQPLYVQYGKWLVRLAQFDFGDSFSQDRRPVLDKIKERLPITILINVLSIGLILAVSVPIGILSAVKRNSPFDRGTTIFVFLGFAMPSFWLALLMIRIAEVEVGASWPKIRRQMQQLNLIEFFDKNGRILQHTELTAGQRNILKKLKIKPPKRVLKVDLAV